MAQVCEIEMSVVAPGQVRGGPARTTFGWCFCWPPPVVASLAIGASDTSLWSALGRSGNGGGAHAGRGGCTVGHSSATHRAGHVGRRGAGGVRYCAAGAISQPAGRSWHRRDQHQGPAWAQSTAIVFGASLPLAVQNAAGIYLIPLMACLGSWVSVLLLYSVSTRRWAHLGRHDASGRDCVGGACLLSRGTDDLCGGRSATARSDFLADWVHSAGQPGPRSSHAWSNHCCRHALGRCRLGGALNGLALGEATAMHLGIPVQRAKNLAVLGRGSCNWRRRRGFGGHRLCRYCRTTPTAPDDGPGSQAIAGQRGPSSVPHC